MSNAHASTNAMGKPNSVAATTNVSVHSGRFSAGKAISAACQITKATTA